MTRYKELSESIEIAATPEQVWALVSDIPRMAQWSPQVIRSTVKDGVVEQGATFTNLNGQGWLRWPTHGKVVRFEPCRDLAFRINENGTVWSFELTPIEGGTLVTQRRELPHGISTVSIVLTRVALGGVARFTARLESGMRETLSKLKADVEASAAA
ncbi:SRPBCC family protein [Nocardioides acrostichi]|uniref:SRPBCC family protein n=1 Tax=Nocardioides acrostichi TaxID=2784339 RepID=A0A930Y9A9_9ACTN|nr:SRPBCC family protein [Nocardioides acrostichi]MBF4163926.1 SRPBCC family protein [Nocardioides acrostichi]